MPSQVLSTVENNFTKGLLTEFTGLNFPENAAIVANNTEFTLIGDVVRREGIDLETNFNTQAVTRISSAIASYRWNNAGGDGETQIVVEQVGFALLFYEASASTVAAPLSTTFLSGQSVDISGFKAVGATFDITMECQFSDGNGYLFVYHPDCDPFYCSFSAGTITANVINVQIRDFSGVNEAGVAVNFRPTVLTTEHTYNLLNQGWNTGAVWSSTSTTAVTPIIGSMMFTIGAGLSVTNGDNIAISNLKPFTYVLGGPSFTVPAGTTFMSGTVTSYSGTTLIVNVYSLYPPLTNSIVATQVLLLYGTNGWNINPNNIGFISEWFSAVSNYPSNADQWWQYKDNTDSFNPAVTFSNVTLNSGPAPKGHYIINAFSQQRSSVAALPGLTPITTTSRPTNGTWFQGRVWYTGVDASQVPAGDAGYYTWTENIYFSQIVTDTTDFGSCYQINDPTSENLFDLLPTDGGVIQIQGAGKIFRLFPIANGLLVFAANGVWFITGSQGIGFSANDYTITKISAVQSISGTSVVDVNGLPYFWNEEGIYMVSANQQGSLTVEPLTVGTILSFYNNIPTLSKKYTRGAYDPIGYVIQWVYKTTQEVSITDRYTYDSILNFSTYNKAFFPYTVDITQASINSIVYVSYPNGGVTSPEASIKYFVSDTTSVTFADEHDTMFVDWFSQGTPVNYKSTFTTGYKLHGQGQRRFQIPYIYVFNRLDGGPISYYLQSVWDYANTGNSGRWSVNQLINIFNPNYDMWINRIRLRGQGLVLQLKFTSVDGQPFDIIGWSAFETQNTGV